MINEQHKNTKQLSREKRRLKAHTILIFEVNMPDEVVKAFY